MTKINSDKRKAIYIIEEDEELIWVTQKRPKISDRDEFRPFWPNMEAAEEAMDRFANGLRVTLYRINKNKVESYRVRRYQHDPNSFTSRDQAQNRLDLIVGSFDYTITRGTISVFFKGNTYNITASDKRFPKLRRACQEEDIAAVLRLINIKTEIKKAVKYKDGSMTLGNNVVPPNLAGKIANSVKQFGDSKTIKAFTKRLLKASASAQKNLLNFLNYHGGCLLEDGRFLAYKYVNNNFHDYHTGKYDYSPGNVVTMPRKDVVEDCRVACAAGLHVGTWGYSGGHAMVLLCVIDPADVVSVPDDYKHQKIRACRVTSICKIGTPITVPVMTNKELEKLAV